MNEKQTIETVAPFLADGFIDFEEPIFDYNSYSEFLDKNADRLGFFRKYLVGKLNDSWIIDISIQPESFIIRLNDFTTHVFADAIIERKRLAIAHEKLVFPLIIKMSGKLNVEYYTVDDTGNLHRTKQSKLDEYLGEQIIHIDKDRFEIVFQFWRKDVNDDKPGENVIVVASAQNLTLTEQQDEAWIELFKNEFDSYYMYFKQEFASNRFVSSFSHCLNLIDEFENGKPYYPLV